MKEFDDIRDDQIRIIGEKNPSGHKKSPRVVPTLIVALLIVGVIALGAIIFAVAKHRQSTLYEPVPAYFEPETCRIVSESVLYGWIGSEIDSTAAGFTEIVDTTINDIALRLYIPHNARMSLHLGKLDKGDTSIVFATQAADVRADNGGIVGAFVLKGEQKSRGLAKRGYCAVIDDRIFIGVAENTPLFEESTAKGGYFFRQYPLVDNGLLVDNEPKGKSVRRALCDRRGEIFMVESLTKESFHDFAQVLVDLGVDNAIYLVGSNALGVYVLEDGTRVQYGDEHLFRGRLPKNTNYIVWRKKDTI